MLTPSTESDPALGDRERRPGGHRARHGRLGDTADRLSGSGTDHVHTVALEVSNVTLAGSRLDFAEWRSPPGGRRTPWVQMCGQFCTGLAELTRVTHYQRPRRARCPLGRRFVSEADVTHAISSSASAPYVLSVLCLRVRKASGSPTPARMAGEATADRCPGFWVDSRQWGLQSRLAVSGSGRRARVGRASQSSPICLPVGTWSEPGPPPSCCQRPFLTGVRVTFGAGIGGRRT